MAKLKAFLVHLLVSIAVVGGLLLVLITRWFPMPYFLADGGWQGIRLVAAVDVVLGPLITLVIYNRAKPRREMLFDYSVIAILQACAFAFGIWTVFSARTAVVVFADGAFYTIAADEARFLHDPYPSLLKEADRGPAYALVTMPTDLEARQALRRESFATRRPLFSFLDLVGPFTADKVPVLAEYELDLNDLATDRPAARAKADRFLTEHGGKLEDYIFLPVRSRYRPVVLAFRRVSGDLVDWLDIAPPSKVSVKSHAVATAGSGPES